MPQPTHLIQEIEQFAANIEAHVASQQEHIDRVEQQALQLLAHNEEMRGTITTSVQTLEIVCDGLAAQELHGAGAVLIKHLRIVIERLQAVTTYADPKSETTTVDQE